MTSCMFNIEMSLLDEFDLSESNAGFDRVNTISEQINFQTFSEGTLNDTVRDFVEMSEEHNIHQHAKLFMMLHCWLLILPVNLSN